MSGSFEELDYRETELGALSLRRRREPMVRAREVFEVKLDDEFLMSSLFTAGEVALADIALDALDNPAADVVVGGLGLGFTADAALNHETVRSLVVIEALAAVIEWHRDGLVPLGQRLASDPRCRFIHGDFFTLADPRSGGFDPLDPGRRFDAVLLDIDHSPRHRLDERSRGFYTVDGLQGLARVLRPGGVFAMWSNDPPDADYESALGAVFAAVRTEIVGFPNPYSGNSSSCTIYVAETGAH